LIHIYDTTLRDGTQRVGLSLSLDDKILIARRLDALGVSFIEGGWPGSNPKDIEFFRRAQDIEWANAKIAAFGSTRRVGVHVEDDVNLRALLESQAPVCTIFGKSWLLHVRDVLRTTPEQNLTLIEESVAYLTANGRTVVYDAEHFFDGYHADPVYAVETLHAAVRGGASTVTLCETNGGTLPGEVFQIVAKVRAEVQAPVGIHAHNDTECAVANSLLAVQAGATQVQGTINGYGERCGNANLCAVIPSLELKLGYRCLPEGQVQTVSDVARYVAEIANLALDDNMPYVGHNAFAHKGGVHVAAQRRNSTSYNHIEPALVGNESRVVVSELSGRGNVITKAEELGISVPSGADVAHVLADIKEQESNGFSYEAAEASVALMVERRAESYRAPWRLIDYMVTVEHRDRRGTFAEATVKVEVNGEVFHTAAEGDGPVSALDRALRKALTPRFPELSTIQLVDYKVRILNSERATGAVTRVLVQCSDGSATWGTVGASENIIEASWRALTDALEFGLRQHKAQERPAKAVGV